MSGYKVGDRIRIDEGAAGEVSEPFTGIGRLTLFAGMLWHVEIEWLKDESGNSIGVPGETYVIFESEIAGVLGEND